MAKSIKEKCNEIGISLPTYYLRLKKGMTPEEALSTPNKRRQPKTEPAPLPISEPEDQEPRAPVTIKDNGHFSYVFEDDFQKAEKKKRQKRVDDAKAKIEEFRNRYRITPNIKVKPQDLTTLPDEDRESYKVDNYEYVHRAPLCYGPIRNGVQSKEPMPWNTADEGKFNRACGGYTAVILNHTKDGEFKYQIYSTNTKKKLYTNDVVRFINQIIKICDPEGKTPFRVIER